ncbi:MAG TPA: HAMP domain-containing sensor histidine kinase [Candidatus Saccharimonadales bacterium]|nr:HAMP domain-containing sensor histidine kinase [Candidatus Saccharimonadales bacterium]
MSVLLLLLLVSFFALGNGQVLGRIVVAAGGVGFIAVLLWLSRRLRYKLAAYLLTIFYFLLAAGSVASWGLSNTFGILLLGLCIILAGIVLRAKHGLYAAVAASLVLVLTQASVEAGWLTVPAPANSTATLGDAIAFSVMFGMIAIISWLFGGRMEHSLAAAEAAEAALEHEKQLLQVRLKRYAKRLQKLQMDEMRQLYQFAEVGQLSTSLLHDLANHLSVLNLEIGGMRSEKHSKSLRRSQAIVDQLDTMLDEVRSRLAGQKTAKAFNLAHVINDAVMRCLRNYSDSGVQIDWQPPAKLAPYDLVGDSIKCGQIVAILLRNACDAYAHKPPGENGRRIVVRLRHTDRALEISVTDWGIGIPVDERQIIFRPTYSTKHGSMGIGLYLARQMVMTEFGGMLRLGRATGKTEFIVTLPTNGH